MLTVINGIHDLSQYFVLTLLSLLGTDSGVHKLAWILNKILTK